MTHPTHDELLGLVLRRHDKSADLRQARIGELTQQALADAERIGLLQGQHDYLRVLVLAKDREIAELKRKLAALECLHCFDPQFCDHEGTAG